MQWVYARSREREISWKLGAVILSGSLALSPFIMMIFEKQWGFRAVRLHRYVRRLDADFL